MTNGEASVFVKDYDATGSEKFKVKSEKFWNYFLKDFSATPALQASVEMTIYDPILESRIENSENKRLYLKISRNFSLIIKLICVLCCVLPRWRNWQTH
ncbi:MAG: hypothetical protein ABFD79_08485 [Phycisphaerales bacterium]